MLAKLITKLTILALRSKSLTGEQKAQVTSELLKNVHSLPIEDIIKYDVDGTLKIRGRTLEYEQARFFKESCDVLLKNNARQIIQEQVAYEAVKMGVHQGLNPEMMVFAKAALWWKEQESKLLSSFVASSVD